MTTENTENNESGQTTNQTPAESGEANQQTAEQQAEEQKRQQEETEKREQEETEKKPWFQKRFNELTQKRYAAEREAERLRKELEDARKQRTEQKPPEQSQQTQYTRPKPTREQFNFDEDQYIPALIAWEIEQSQTQVETRRQQEREQQTQHQAQAEFDQKVDTMNVNGMGKYSDWRDVVWTVPPPIFHQELVKAITESPMGADIAYHLGKNLQEAERISKLSPYAMAAEIGKLELKISNPEKKTTKAPPPVNPVGGRGMATSELDPSKDTLAWIQARNEGKI